MIETINKEYDLNLPAEIKSILGAWQLKQIKANQNKELEFIELQRKVEQ